MPRAFRADFEAACEQVELLGDYKELHDGLHNLRFTCYNQIARSTPRFPDDDLVLELLANYELEMEQILVSVRQVRDQARVAVVSVRWLGALADAQGMLRQFHNCNRTFKGRNQHWRPQADHSFVHALSAPGRSAFFSR